MCVGARCAQHARKGGGLVWNWELCYEHLRIMYLIQCLNMGPLKVLAGSSSSILGTGAGRSVAGAANGHFLAGGYPARVADRLPSGPWGAGAAQSFGCFGRGLAGRGELVERGRNGGILPISARLAGLVGRVALEGWSQALEIAGQSGLRRQPVRLRRAAWSRPIGGAPPPLPPFAEASAPSSLTLDLGWILGRHRGERLLLALSEQAEPRQVWCGGIGSGWGSDRSLARRRAGRSLGLGDRPGGAVFRGKLRRSGDASAGVASVN